MKKIRISVVFILLLGVLFGGAFGFAEDIKTRMKSRLPDIVDMKLRGIIGENNMGYLQFVGSEKEKEAVVAAENTDRKLIYEAIGKQQGVSPEVVGKRRAIQLVELAQTGEWLQNEAGQWYRK